MPNLTYKELLECPNALWNHAHNQTGASLLPGEKQKYKEKYTIKSFHHAADLAGSPDNILGAAVMTVINYRGVKPNKDPNSTAYKEYKKDYDDKCLSYAKYKMTDDRLEGLYELISRALEKSKSESTNEAWLTKLTQYFSESFSLLKAINRLGPKEKDHAMNLFAEWAWKQWAAINPDNKLPEKKYKELITRDNKVYEMLGMDKLKQDPNKSWSTKNADSIKSEILTTLEPPIWKAASKNNPLSSNIISTKEQPGKTLAERAEANKKPIISTHRLPPTHKP